jgi:hypothetical protein
MLCRILFATLLLSLGTLLSGSSLLLSLLACDSLSFKFGTRGP